MQCVCTFLQFIPTSKSCVATLAGREDDAWDIVKGECFDQSESRLFETCFQSSQYPHIKREGSFGLSVCQKRVTLAGSTSALDVT
jgi:hypothetical protein